MKMMCAVAKHLKSSMVVFLFCIKEDGGGVCVCVFGGGVSVVPFVQYK